MSGNVRKPKAPTPAASAGSGRALRRLAPSSTAQAVPRHSAAVTRFWRANCEATVFHAPFGNPVGVVEPGIVVEEGMRFVDCFDDMWIAVQAEDLSAVWVRRHATAALTDAREPEWDPVAEAATTTSTPAEVDFQPLNLNDNVMAHALTLVTQDAVLMEHYWANVRQPDDVDWNHQFQSAVEDVLYKLTPATVDSRKALADLIANFADEVEDSAALIVHEMFAASSERTIKRHPMAMDTYYHRGIMYRVCVDTSGGLFGGDRNALKVASQLHKTMHKLLSVGPLVMVSIPLVTIMTTNGYRILASTIPPVSLDRLLVGLCGTTSGTSTSPLPKKLLATLGRELGLKQHAYGSSSGGVTEGHLPVDAQLYAGRDHRFYLLNTGRLFPPVAPSTRCTSYHPLTSPLFQRIRPEVLERCGRPLNPDAFFPECSNAVDNGEIATISQWLRDEGIPTVAAIIGMHEAVEHPDLDSVTCCGCSREVTNELRFVVCRDAQCGCSICSQCYLDILKLDRIDNEKEAAQERLSGIKLKCGADGGSRRALNGLVLQPDVTTLFHANCVNMRYLPLVYQRLPPSAAMCTGKYLEVEMMARSAKHLLWQKLRVAHDVEEAHKLCINFFLGLLQPEGDVAERFWANELGPAVQSQFDIFAPFNTADMDIELVYTRVAELTGVELTAASVDSFATDTPFVQLKSIHPVMKLLHIPPFVETVGEHQAALKGKLEDVFLFWIGFENGAEEPEWSERYPLFMKERF